MHPTTTAALAELPLIMAVLPGDWEENTWVRVELETGHAALVMPPINSKPGTTLLIPARLATGAGAAYESNEAGAAKRQRLETGAPAESADAQAPAGAEAAAADAVNASPEEPAAPSAALPPAMFGQPLVGLLGGAHRVIVDGAPLVEYAA